MIANTHRMLLVSAVIALTSVGAAPVLAANGVSQQPIATQPSASGESGKYLNKDQDAKNSKLLAAAEPFEALTEQAFTAKPAKIKTLVSQVEQAAQKVNSKLSQQEQQQLSQRISEVKQAEQANKPHELALAAVEGYRILVSATQNTTVPKAVSLLDYAGFRYGADLKSHSTRWSDMQQAVQFAENQWHSINGQVSDRKLKNSFSQSLTHMADAVSNKKAHSAQKAVKSEQDLVDKLEGYFNKH